MRHPLSTSVVFVALLALAGHSSTAGAQADEHNGDDPAKTPTLTSYLNTNFQAQEALDRAQKYIDRKNWPAAAVAYQNIGEQFGHYLIDIEPNHYVSIRRYVNDQVVDWPKAGLAAYRAAFEKAAESALANERGGETIERLVSIAARYYATQAGARALDEASQLAIEYGDFQSASQWYAHLLSNHPDREKHRLEWQTKRAVCSAWQGDLAGLRRLSRELDTKDVDSLVDWAGRRQPLGDFVKKLLTQIEANGARPPPPSAAEAQMFCGNARRSAFFSTKPAVEARLWQFTDFGKGGFAGVEDREDSGAGTRSAYLRSLGSGRLLTSFPVFGDGRLYCHDHRSVWAIDLDDTDKRAWRVDLFPTPDVDMQWMNEDEPPNQFTTLWVDGRLYVHLENKPDKTGGAELHKTSALACLNAATGETIWQNNLEGLASAFEDLRLDGAPLMHRGKLFAVARRRKAFGFETCLLLCLDPLTGRLLWHTHVGEAPTGSYGYYRPTRVHPAAAGDRVIVHTNLGTIAAVSATTGHVIWLTTYPSKYADDSEMAWSTRMGRPVRSWQYQPTMLWRDAVLCIPLDLEEVLVLDQTDGRIRKRIPLERLINPDAFLGLRGDVLYAVGSQVVCYDLSKETIAWQRPLADGELLGRGVVTAGGLLIPTNRALLHYPLDGGPAQTFPWKPREAGNLIALPDQIVVAAADSLSGLVSQDAALARLTDHMKQRPEDHRRALALADLAFDIGKNRQGLDAVHEAVDRLGGFSRIHDDQTRRQLFRRLLDLSRRLSRSEEPPARPPKASPPGASHIENLDVAIKLLEMAGQCTTNTREQVTYRLLLAGAQLRRGKPDAAVATYQQILSDRSLRRLRMPIPSEFMPPGSGVTFGSADERLESVVGFRVEEWIDGLIRRYGRKAYEAVENQAKDGLKVARATENTAALLEVAKAFPNSRIHAEALLAHARLAQAVHERRASLRSYRRVVTNMHMQDAQRPAVLREYVNALADAGQLEQADHWLQRAARDHSAFRFEQGGRRIGFSDLRRSLIGDRRFRNPAHAIMTWPVRKAFSRLYSDRVTMLEPVLDRLPDTEWDAILTYDNGRIEARSADSGRSLWPAPIPCGNQPIFLSMQADSDVFATTRRLFAISRSEGRIIWQFGDEAPDDPSADPESLPAWTSFAMTDQRLFATSDRSELVCIDLQDGSLRWHRETGDGAANHLAADDRHVFYARWEGRNNVIHILSAETGKELGTSLNGEVRTYQQLIPTENGNLLVVLSRSIFLIRPADGEVLWRIDTPDHYVLASLAFGTDGLFISDDGRRIAKYDLDTGRQLWRTPPISENDRDGLWSEVVGMRLLAASADTLAAFDTADGRELWTTESAPGLQLHPPIVVVESLITISPDDAGAPPLPGVGDGSGDADHANAGVRASRPRREGREPVVLGVPVTSRRYRIRRFNVTDGRESPVTEAGALVTEPIKSLGGVFARNRCLLLLDGRRLVGYVGPVE
jgi:outer membrane protein assembly factor BamB